MNPTKRMMVKNMENKTRFGKLPKKIPINEIQADLKSIEFELKEVEQLPKGKARIDWAKKNPEKWAKIDRVYMKYMIQWSIETLEELHALVEERFAPEKARCEAIISRTYHHLPH